MKVSYFPGCTLKNKAKDLDVYAYRSAAALGVTLEEIEHWQCCGGVFTSAANEVATKLSSVRALKEAAEKGQPLVTVCSACHNVIKQTNHAMQTNAEFASKVNRYMAADGGYAGEAEVCHYLEMLRDLVGFDKIKEKVVAGLAGKKIAAYYGCLLLRPNKVMRMDDPENPTIMEDLIRSLGGEAVVYARRNECCGAYISVESPDAAKYNLEKCATDMPIVYFTELLALALGVKEDTNGEQ